MTTPAYEYKSLLLSDLNTKAFKISININANNEIHKKIPRKLKSVGINATIVPAIITAKVVPVIA